MQRQIAFLRAINVGGHVVKMERLRALFESFGLPNVETFIASGNVVFEPGATNPAELEQSIEQLLRKELGYEVKTFIRSNAELAKIAKYNPFDAATAMPEATLFVGFLAKKPDAATRARMLAAQTEVDDFHLHGRELYWRVRVKSNESKFSGAKLERTLGMATTLRNVNTVRRLVAKYPPAQLQPPMLRGV